MDTNSLDEFLISSDTFRVYQQDKLIFTSNKDRIVPLLEYIDNFMPHHEGVTIFDRIVGNAAALLAIKARCNDIYSPMGSQLAIETLNKYGIKYHLTRIIPYILKPDGNGLCPMEKLSMGKDPDNFYVAIKDFINRSSSPRQS